MEPVVLVIHLILALAIIGLVLLQRSEGGGLGIGGGGLGGLSTPKGTADALTRATAICAGLFFCTSLILGIMAGTNSQGRISLMEQIKQEAPAATAPAPDAAAAEGAAPSAPVQPEPPAAPIAE